MFDPTWWIDSAWTIFLVYWFIAAFRVNRMRRREPLGQRFARLGPTIVILLAFYWVAFRWDILNGPFVSQGLVAALFCGRTHLGWISTDDLGSLSPRQILERDGRTA